MAICSHINQNVSATVRRNTVHQMIIDASFGTKNFTSRGAVKNTRTPIILSNQNESRDQILDILSALSKSFAHIFCQTRIEIAIESPNAGMIISCKIFEPAQYEAIVCVPKLVIRNVNTTIPSPREDISNEEGNHKKKAFFMYQKSGLKFNRLRWILYLPLNNIVIQITAANH
jgi:hypothetical protein